MDELHRGRLAVGGGAVDVLLRRADHLVARELQETGLLDPAELGEDLLAQHRIVDLEHQGGDQFPAIRNQRIIGLQLVQDLRGAALLDEQHLVDLQPHGVVALEIECGMGTQGHPAVLLDLDQGLTLVRTDLGVGVHVHDIGCGDLVRHFGALSMVSLVGHGVGIQTSESVGSREDLDGMIGLARQRGLALDPLHPL